MLATGVSYLPQGLENVPDPPSQSIGTLPQCNVCCFMHVCMYLCDECLLASDILHVALLHVCMYECLLASDILLNIRKQPGVVWLSITPIIFLSQSSNVLKLAVHDHMT